MSVLSNSDKVVKNSKIIFKLSPLDMQLIHMICIFYEGLRSIPQKMSVLQVKSLRNMTKIQLSQNKIFTKKGQLKMLYLLHFFRY